MLGAPVDALYVWVALAVVSACFLGVALETPTHPAPDAAGLAESIDTVAASPAPTRGAHPVSATAVRIGPRRVALRSDGGVAHATLAYGPVTPVEDGSRLGRVLRGAPPGRVFETGSAFRRAVVAAREDGRHWHRTDGRLVVRHLTWEGVDVTLVG